MPRESKENYVAKQQRIGERLSRAMAKAHIDRRELAALTGYSEAQIVLWERGRAPLYPTEPGGTHRARSFQKSAAANS